MINSKIKLIIGIGNNFNKYLNTRHNIGIFFIKKLSSINNKKFIYKKIINGFISEINIKNKILILFIPNSFMNTTGIYIKNILNHLFLNPKEIMICHDDIYLKPGVLKIKFGGSFAGHKGIENIINNINNNFYRLRIGIGCPKFSKDKISDFVLSKPSLDDTKLIVKSIDNFIHNIDFLL